MIAMSTAMSLPMRTWAKFGSYLNSAGPPWVTAHIITGRPTMNARIATA